MAQVIKPVDARSYGDQLKQLYKEVDEQIEYVFERLPKDKNGRVMFPYGVTADYSDGAEYSIMGLIKRDGDMLVCQSEEGGPDYDEQPFCMNIDVKIDVLDAIQTVYMKLLRKPIKTK